MGVNKIEYLDDVRAPTSDLTTAKCFINSTLSTPKAICLVADIHDFYLNTTMKRFEYTRMKLDMIPEETSQQYKLDHLQNNRWVYIEIKKGVYGLP